MLSFKMKGRRVIRQTQSPQKQSMTSVVCAEYTQRIRVTFSYCRRCKLLKSKPEAEKTRQLNNRFGRETGDNYLLFICISKAGPKFTTENCQTLTLTVVHAHIYQYVRIWFDGCKLDISMLSAASSFASCVNRNQDFSHLSAKSRSANQN